MVLDAEQIEGWASNAYSRTYSGARFHPEQARIDEVLLIDIAHHLSMVNRFGGATIYPYSVAQHSLLCAAIAREVAPGLVLWALLHDAAEYVMGDVVTPLKRAIPSYGDIELQVLDQITSAFNLPQLGCVSTPMLKEIDMIAYEIEREHLLQRPPPRGPRYMRGFELHLEEMDWRTVRATFYREVEHELNQQYRSSPLDRSPHVPV